MRNLFRPSRPYIKRKYKALNLGLMFILALGVIFSLMPSEAHSMDRRGRLGIGYSNQFILDLPAISFKHQRSRSFSYGGIFAIDTERNGGFGAGIKVYRNLFEEPQLNFYTAGLLAILNDKRPGLSDKRGFQADWTFGSEFSFSGLQSLGFSFEFGISLNKVEEFKVQTTGHQFITGAIHFYL